MQVCWTEDADGLGWTGDAVFWTDGNTREPPDHTLSLRQGMPLGSISLAVDEISHGAWAYTHFEGAGLTERDLQWAAAYASEALKRKRELSRAESGTLD
jgi:hypothetical protein